MDRPMFFKAMRVEENPDHRFARSIVQRPIEDLPPGDVLIRVLYSSLNYKDALSATGNKGVTRQYPHTPGIDAAGEVVESRDPGFQPGERVIVVGTDLGSNTPGGYGQYIRVPAGWVMHLPEGLTLLESMAYGTAGFTAAMSVYRLVQEGVTPDQGEVLVTGATGGLGIFAIALLARAGFSVVAATGKLEQKALLQSVGAKEVIQRDEVTDASDRALLKGRWAGAIDSVGGSYLAAAIRSTRPGGCVLSCGNAASAELNLTVYPFILRGVTLAGMAVNLASPSLRRLLWSRLAGEWKMVLPEGLIRERRLEDLDEEIERTLHGQQIGRVVVSLG